MMMKCKNCSYRYEDGFCMLNCYYVSDEHSCNRFTTEDISFDFDRIYRLCKQYIEICEMYNEQEKMKIKYPTEITLNNFDNLQFFLNCCLNDLHREMSLWKTKR